MNSALHVTPMADAGLNLPLAILATSLFWVVFIFSRSALERAPSLSRGKTILAFVTALLAVIGLFYPTRPSVDPATQAPSARTSPEIDFTHLIFAVTGSSIVAVLIVAMGMKCCHRIHRVWKRLCRSGNEDRKAFAKDNRSTKKIDAGEKRRARKHNPSGRFRRGSEVD